MKEIIIFCQAPADIQYALTIYEKYKNSSMISIFCINMEGMYKFISSLNLTLKELILIPYPVEISIKNPVDIITERNRLKKLFKRHFLKISGYELYFFSNRYDWV
ncbi:MAG: hypothetical protein PF487_02630, partial [Bacteroidales bacterium]|nr:hypothetical protein [Bacteroidales bacterium]